MIVRPRQTGQMDPDPAPIDPQSAFNAVEELLSAVTDTRGDLPDGTFHLHQTDGDGELMLAVVDGRVIVTHEHGKGDAALRATGEEMLLALRGHRSLDGLELFGDRRVAEEWIALAP